MTIRFGTDGWRAVISDEFTFQNLRRVAQAVADHVLETAGEEEPALVVGFDTRFLSDRYAREVARVLAASGIQVYLSQTDTPTPAISFAVREMRAAGGVMITASHNPPRYNGFKLKAACGGPASPAEIEGVEDHLARNQREGREPRLSDFEKAETAGRIVRFDPMPAYQAHLATLVDLDRVARSGLRVVVDPMYGSGRRCLAGMLSSLGLDVEEIHGEMNPGFGGLHPEPIGRNLGELAARLGQGGWDAGLALDGDADRIGAMDARGQFVDPHQIFALVLRYLVEARGWRGSVVKTVSTTQMVNRLARRHGLRLHETPVGFHYICQWMLRDDVLMGGEESGGMSVRGHVPEGDGVLMGLFLLEVVAYAGASLADVVASLSADLGPCCYGRRDHRLTKPFEKEALVRRLVAGVPTSLAGQGVVDVNDRDGVKLLLADDSWLLIRPSGTEPVLRIYAEARSSEALEALLLAGEDLGTQALGGS